MPIVFNSAVATVSKLTNLPMNNISFAQLPSNLCSFVDILPPETSTIVEPLVSSCLLEEDDSVINEEMKQGLTLAQAHEKFETWSTFVKDINTYEPYKLALGQHPSYITSDEIIDRILSHISRVEGPVSSFILKPREELENILGRQAPVLWLLGDLHVGREKCKPVCEASNGCFSLYVPDARWTHPEKYSHLKETFLPFLQSIAETPNNVSIATDFFTEIWSFGRFEHLTPEMVKDFDFGNPLEIQRELHQHDSSMKDVFLDVFSCFANRNKPNKDCPAPHVRIHAADPRANLLDIEYLFRKIGSITMADWTDLCDTVFNTHNRTFATSEEKRLFRIDTYAVCLSLIINRLRLGLSQFAKIYTRGIQPNDSSILRYQKRILQMHSRTIHELMQIPEEIRLSMVDCICEMEMSNDTHANYAYPDLFADFPTHEGLVSLSGKALRSINNIGNKLHEFVKALNLSKGLYLFGIESSMDFFALSRALKSPLKGLPSQLSCIYAGNAHINNYINYFTTYMPYYELASISSFTQDKKKGQYDQNKCVDVRPVSDSNDLLRMMVAHAANTDRAMNGVFLSEVCMYLTLQPDQLSQDEIWDLEMLVGGELTWKSFYYNANSSEYRKLKEKDKVLNMIPYLETFGSFELLVLLDDLLHQKEYVVALINNAHFCQNKQVQSFLKTTIYSIRDPQVVENATLALSHCRDMDDDEEEEIDVEDEEDENEEDTYFTDKDDDDNEDDE